VEPRSIQTPVAPASGVRLSAPKPLVVPILRAGLGMLDGMTRLVPTAEVGFLGMIRDEHTSRRAPTPPACRTTCPDGRCSCSTRCWPPAARWSPRVRYVVDRGATDVTAICLLAAPEGVAALETAFGSEVPVTVVVAGMDERLNDVGFIVPGLGDAGDRLYGVV
jgi:uracil phosphoribosyltransferase